MSQPARPIADADLIEARLRARHQTLERQLEAGLQRARLSRQLLAEAAALAGRVDPEQLARATRQLETELARSPGLRFQELARPALADAGRRLLRA